MFSLRPSGLTFWTVFVLIGSLHASFYAPADIQCDDPNPVTELAVTLSSYSNFVLTWTPPSNVLERCIHAYNVSVTPFDGGKGFSSSTWLGYFHNDATTLTSPCTNYTATIYVVGYPGISNGTSITFYTGAAKAQSLEASNVTPTAAQLTWQSPASLTCADHFKLYHCAYEGSAEQDCVYETSILPLNSTSTKLDGLESCKSNTVRLATVDTFGSENYVSIVVHTGDGNPPKARSVTLTSNQGSSVAVSWPTPEYFKAQCHGGYRVCSTSGRDNSTQCYFTSSNTTRVEKLTACTNYTVSVQTVDGELREDSLRSDATTLDIFTNPNMPATTVGFSSNQIVSLTWPGLDNFSSSCIRDFQVVECVEKPYTSGSCEVLNNDTLPVESSSFNTSALTSCATSHILFYAVCNTGGKSFYDMIFINDYVPKSLQPLANLSVVSADVKHLTLAWTPSDFNKCTYKYRICWYVNRYKKCADSTRERGDTFSGLSLLSCHSYIVRIMAVHRRIYSNSISQTFGVGPSNAQHQSVQLTPTSALVKWWRDTAVHRCNTGYKITWCPASIFSNSCGESPTGSVTLPDTSSSYNITNLEICEKYLLVFQTLGKNDSLVSDPNATVIQTPIGKFGPITDLSIRLSENNTVVLDVVFPYNSTKCITTFTTCLYETDSENAYKYCRLQRTEWVNKTQACTNYTVDITATTNDHQTANGSITFLTGPGQVSDVTVRDDVDSKSVNVTWVNNSPGASRCVHHLEVRCTPAETSEPVVQESIPADATGIVLEGLGACTSYTLEIEAVAPGSLSKDVVVKQFTTTWSSDRGCFRRS